MANISGIVKSARNIMRQDTGTGSDELRILQLGWMLFLKIFSDKDKELEVLQDDYIRQKLLEDCNLHTIIRLPNSVFQPYASVATNLLFFTKGEPTRKIWYWEHQLPEGYKAYSKTKPIQAAEFDQLKKWWDKQEESEQAWVVDIEKKIKQAKKAASPYWEKANAEKSNLNNLKVLLKDKIKVQKTDKIIKERKELQRKIANSEKLIREHQQSGDNIYFPAFNLDIKTPHQPEEEKQHSSAELLDMLHQSFAKGDQLLAQLRKELAFYSAIVKTILSENWTGSSKPVLLNVPCLPMKNCLRLLQNSPNPRKMFSKTAMCLSS